MSKIRYFLDEFSKDDVFHSLAQTARHVLQQNDDVVKIYQTYSKILYGQSPKRVLYLMRLNNQSLFSSSPWSVPDNPEEDKTSDSGKRNQAPLIQMKRNRNASHLKKICLPKDNEDDGASQSVFVIPDPFATPAKITRNVKFHENLAEKQLAVINADNKESVTTNQGKVSSAKKNLNFTDYEGGTQKHLSPDNVHVEESKGLAHDQKKLSSPEKYIRNVPDSEMRFEHLPFENKDIGNLKPAQLEAHSSAREMTVNLQIPDRAVLSLTDNTYTADQKYISPSAERTNMANNTMLFRSIPKVIQSSGTIEVEITSQSTHNLSSSDKTVTADKMMFNQDKRFSEDDVKARNSQELSPSVKKSTNYPTVTAKANNPSTENGTNFEKYQSPDDFFKARSLTGHRSVTLTSSRTSNTEPDTLIYCITQLIDLVLLREKYLLEFFNSLSDFKKDLEYLLSYMNNIARFVKNINVRNKDYITEEFKKNVCVIIPIVSKFLGKFSSWKMDVEMDILNWNECFEQISEIKNEPFISDGEPLITFEQLIDFEDELMTKWRELDDMILIADSRRSSFSATAHDMEKLMNCFVTGLIEIGILKLAPEPLL